MVFKIYHLATLLESSRNELRHLWSTLTPHFNTGRPDWAIFCLLGDFSLFGCLFTLGDLLKIAHIGSANFCDTFSTVHVTHVHSNFDEKWVEQHFGHFFTNLSGHPASMPH
jgi:hypothetical protein